MFVTLLYHIINRTIDAKVAVSEEAFEAHLHYLSTHDCTVLSLTQAIDVINGKCPPLDRAVLLTFDDAYTEIDRVALPLLRTYGMTATLFVVSKYIGRTNRWDHKACFDAEHMNWKDLETWLVAGNEIGGHSHEHLCMTRLNTNEVSRTVLLNRQILEDHLRTKLRAFSYPYGESNSEVQRIVAEYYEVAFATENGGWPSSRNRYAIKRLGVDPRWSMIKFAERLEILLGKASGLRKQ